MSVALRVSVECAVVGEPDMRDTYTRLHIESARLISAAQPTRTVRGLFARAIKALLQLRGSFLSSWPVLNCLS